jgi:hypothetical protein
MLIPHTSHCATLYNGKIYVMGGGALANNPTFAGKYMEVYDPASDSWAPLPGLPLPEGLVNFGCNAVNGKIYIISPDHVFEYSPDD